MTIAVKFILLDLTEIEFYDDEALDAELIPVTDLEYQDNDNELPVMEQRGDVWYQLKIKFRETYSTTKAKLQQLLDEHQKMYCYYCYQADAGEYKTVFLLPDTNEFQFFNGDPEAIIEHEFTFLETI
jgi:hypothetical protein